MRITQLLSFTTEANVFISIQSRQGWCHLVPWKYAPSSVTQISTLPIVSIDVVSPSGT